MRDVCCTVCVMIVMACMAAAHGIEHPECKSNTNCRLDVHKSDSYFYYHVNGTNGYKDQQVIVKLKEMDYFILTCNSHGRQIGYKLAADDPSLPAMSRLVEVKSIEIKGCTVPNGSYSSALAALNITFSLEAKDNILKLTELPMEPRLEGYHLHELPIKGLLITGNSSSQPTRPKFDFLDKVPRLQYLELTRGVVLETEAIVRMPEALKNLTLVNTQLPAAESKLRNGTFWLERLRTLRNLHLVETSMGAMGSVGFTLAPPPLASLPNLTIASLHHLPLAPLPQNWLNGSKLQTLVLKSCGLDKLPNNIFKNTNLTKVSLINNKLSSLPKGVFSPLQWLTELDLSGNKLRRVELVDAVLPLERLESLRVNNNPQLGSLCGDATIIQGKEKSLLPKSLRRLELSKTGATRICDDWIEDSSYLTLIALVNNNIKELRYSDLKMIRDVRTLAPVLLVLNGNPLKTIDVTRQDFNNCLSASSSEDWGRVRPTPVKLKLNSALACDCDAFWLRETLRHCPLLAFDRDVTCFPKPPAPAPKSLLAHKPQDFTCHYNGPCPTECDCRTRALDNATVVRCEGAIPLEARWPPAAPGWPLALHVAPGTLVSVPRVALVELYASNNNITSINDNDIPDTLRVLDVRNNSIAHISTAAAQQLQRLGAAHGSRVSLSGNPLACACEDAPAIAKLKHAEVMDWNMTLCVDGNYVIGKTTIEMCESKVMLPLLGATGTLLMVTLMALFLRYLLPYIRQFLFEDDPDDPTKTHDVFISYSYNDIDIAKKLIEKLEEHGNSTIEHCRDWLPGMPVSQQIAQSVMSARRTLLLVSDNFANSKWGLEEFHAAHAHAMERGSARIIVVRCKLLAPQALPPELQLYLYKNTYLDWSDRYFWDKLWRVMPTPQNVPAPTIHNQKTPLSVRIQVSPQNTASALSLSRVLANKEPPLSELVLVPPVPATRRWSKLDPKELLPASSCLESPTTPVAWQSPLPGDRKSPLSQKFQREPLTAPVVPASISPCAC